MHNGSLGMAPNVSLYSENKLFERLPCKQITPRVIVHPNWADAQCDLGKHSFKDTIESFYCPISMWVILA